eukprot:3264891-Pyramimonas_sp.AAC.1
MNVFKNDSQSSAPVVFIYPRAFLKITPELEFRWHQAWQGNNSQGDLPVQRSLTVKHSRRGPIKYSRSLSQVSSVYHL